MKALRTITLLFLLFQLLTIQSCRVDDLLYAKPENEVIYNFTNEALEIDSSFFIDESLAHVFSLQSKIDGENPEEIWALYLGNIDHISVDTVILFCHGNAPSMNDYWDRIAAFANIGSKHHYGIMAVDYRGFGNSTGKSSTKGFRADLHACIDWLEYQGLTQDRLIVYGYSLGGIPSTLAATNQDNILSTQKLILDAPLTGANAVIQDYTGLSLPGAIITDLDVDAIKEIAQYNGDLLWFHAANDSVVPFKHGYALFNAHSGNYKEQQTRDEGGHNFFMYHGIPYYLDIMHNFIRK